jgi:hypothetical protein
MHLDIRYPIGLLFVVIGGILAAYGLFSGPDANAAHSLGININLWWGGIQVAFGAVMIGLAKGAKGGNRRP